MLAGLPGHGDHATPCSIDTLFRLTYPLCDADLSSRQPPNSPRPPLARCSEAEFLDDVCAFLTGKRGKKLARAAFPDAQVGGSQLDLFTLYKEVVSRGGYKCALGGLRI